jgi:indole-3-glycerol phosphate synthase
MPADILRVAESGIHGHDDLKRLQMPGSRPSLSAKA